MKLNVIATGSSGNLYELIDAENNSMIMEAGKPRSYFIKHRDNLKKMPEMCVITHSHGDHAKYRDEYEALCKVFYSKPIAESENFKCLGLQIKHNDVLNYAYIIRSNIENKYVFFATDWEYEESNYTDIVDVMRHFIYEKNINIETFILEVNYNDYLYHLSDNVDRIGNSYHFSDNNAIKFIRDLSVKRPKIITIHGSNKLSTNSYTRSYLKSKLEFATIAVAENKTKFLL